MERLPGPPLNPSDPEQFQQWYFLPWHRLMLGRWCRDEAPLGRHVLRQAVAAGHAVTVFVRTPSKLLPDVRDRVSVHAGDLSTHVPLDLIKGQDALIKLPRPRRGR